jgi:hypothetical protein
LQTAFPDVIPKIRPLAVNKTIADPQWLAGFVSKILIWYMGIRYYSTPSLVLNKRVKEKKALQQMSQSTSIVFWGKNLTSTVRMGRFTKQVRNMIELPPYQKSVIIGLILSDGWLRFSSKTNKNAHLGLKQSLAHSDYIWFVFSILSHYCDNLPTLRLGKKGEKSHWSLEIVTRALPCFTELHSIFYVDGVKIIPHNIYDILTPVALAHLIMGDGSARSHGLVLCTDSFTIPEIVKLMNVLLIKYQLDCIFRFHTPTQPRIYIKEGSMPFAKTDCKALHVF